MNDMSSAALLCATPDLGRVAQVPRAPGPRPAPPEDESADPVGDGHSDADLAERQNRPAQQPPPDPD
jgi:hypothetical protein